MAWTAVQHLGSGQPAMLDDPAVIGLDRDLAAALVCFAAVPAVLWPRLRHMACVVIMMAVAYTLSVRHLAGTLALDAFMLAPLFLAALYIWWPQLVEVQKPDA